MRQNTVSIIRFMATSTSSSDIESVRKSITDQLEKVFKIDAIKNGDYKTKDFSDKLNYISEKFLERNFSDMNKNKTITTRKYNKLLILFDSIDQVPESKYDFSWLLYYLPKHVKIIYSLSKDSKIIYNKLKNTIPKENILEMNSLATIEAKNILSSLLDTENRKLSENQLKTVNKLIDSLEYIYPLQVKLIFDVVSKWKSSYEVPNDFMSCTTSIETIKYLFRIIEKRVINNEVLFKHCLFYLTLFEYKGISENELEDILSIDDEVLSSIFIFHHPPVRRFPMALWYRIKYELKEFLTNKMVDDVSVVAWYKFYFIKRFSFKPFLNFIFIQVS